jgi:hypothetical protein
MAKITVSDLTINQEQENFLQELKNSEIAEVKGGCGGTVVIIIIIEK